MAVHARVLTQAYATPDAFLGQVYAESKRRMNRDPERDEEKNNLKLQSFLNAISANTVQLVSQLCTLEHKQTKQDKDFSTLRFEALTDPLTKVLNRRGYFNLAEQRLGKNPGACCMLRDLTGLKKINDEHGHDAGDLILRGLAKLLRRSVARCDIIARLGGDEFALLITDIDEHDARIAASRVRDLCLGKRIRITPEKTVEVSFSLGAVFHESVGGDVHLEQLMATADELMYQRKRSGEPGIIFARFGSSGDSIASSPAV
jgi:diguanylate cyclase (GGDEF)-like protein